MVTCSVFTFKVNGEIVSEVAGGGDGSGLVDGGCGDPIVLVDGAGNVFPSRADALGNRVITINPAKKIVEYDGSDTPDPSCCATLSDNGNLAFNTASRCVDQICVDGVWSEFCGVGGGGINRVSICYDLSYEDGSYGDECFGQPGTGWVVGGNTVWAPVCDTASEASAYPSQVRTNTGWTLTDGSVPGAADMPGLWTGSADTGEASGPTTSFTVSGSPVVFVKNSAGFDGVQPFKARFSLAGATGPVGFALWDQNTNTLLPITGAAASIGTQLSYTNVSGFGDYATIRNPDGDFEFTFDASPGVNTGGLVFVFGGLTTETVFDLSLGFESVSATCCECHSPAGLASIFQSVDPHGGTWTSDGGKVCGLVPITAAGEYGTLTSCSLTVEPGSGSSTLIAVSDFVAAAPGEVVTVNAAGNDDPAVDPTTLRLLDGGIQTTTLVVAEGSWSVNTATGVVTFTPTGTASPTPVQYSIGSADGRVATATITVTYGAPAPVFTAAPEDQCVEPSGSFDACWTVENGTITGYQWREVGSTEWINING